MAFYYDADLDGDRDIDEAALVDLDVSAGGPCLREADGSIRLPPGRRASLHVRGTSPGGKPLTNATFREPFEVVMLPDFDCEVGSSEVSLGLADGYLSSPIRPDEMSLAGYEAIRADPGSWESRAGALYPEGWAYPKNYFYYGYRIPEGGLAGSPHLAFDIGAGPGVAVRASAPGTIVEPLFDWKFGIGGPYGVIYYNHITPAASVGDRVERYDIVGHIAEGQGDHVHMELRPRPESILSAFPGAGEGFFIKNPSAGESAPVPPYFGPR